MSTLHPEPSEDLMIGAANRAMPMQQAGKIGLLVGVIGLAVSLFLILGGGPGAELQHQTVLGSYLFGWYFWMTIVLGMLGITILHHTVRSSYALPWLKILQAGASPVALVTMLVLFLPVLFQPGVLYEWVNPGHDQVLLRKLFYLNVPWWTARTFIFFGIWIFFSWFLRNSVRRQESGDPKGLKLEMGRSSWGAFGIVVFVLTLTFAVTDWGMSLQPHWYSTMYGVWQMVGSALGASAFIVALICLNAKKAPYTEVITPNLTKDWGNILFMWTMLWAYTSVSQYLIIWNGNLPETASYFARRGQLGWNGIGMAMILGQFLLPWMTLLSPRVKRYPHLLRSIAGWILFAHAIDVYYAIVPALPNGGFGAHHGRLPISGALLFDLLALVSVGGIWMYVLSVGLAKTKELLPTYDHRLQEALKHAH